MYNERNCVCSLSEREKLIQREIQAVSYSAWRKWIIEQLDGLKMHNEVLEQAQPDQDLPFTLILSSLLQPCSSFCLSLYSLSILPFLQHGSINKIQHYRIKTSAL